MAVYRFGDCSLDTRSGELRRGGHRVRLRPQPAAVLEYLISHPGEVVSRGDLRQVLWPEGTYVHFDHGLNSCVKQLRAALGEDRMKPRYLETLTRRGYRFMAAVTLDEPRPGRRAERIRLAVQPFASLVAGDGGIALAEGLTEDLSVRLTTSDPAAIAVVGGPRAARGDGADARASFALSGSVRVIGGGFRVTAQLVAQQSREQVWADAFDGALVDVLRAQAQIAERISVSVVRAIREEGRATVGTTSQADALAG